MSHGMFVILCVIVKCSARIFHALNALAGSSMLRSFSRLIITCDSYIVPSLLEREMEENYG